MTIYRAQHAGFCFGVKRALNLAREAGKSIAGKAIYTYGELIHNPQIVAELESSGIKVINDVNTVKDSVVIIRSHGITKQDKEILLQNGNTLMDATCPYVSRTHELIESMVSEGYHVYIMGDANHPEVIGMMSYGAGSITVIDPASELPELSNTKVSLISQTTQNMDDLARICSLILPQVRELRIFNTICLATTERQRASMEIAGNTELVFVIGGKHSANTRQLYDICAGLTKCIYIEDADDIDPEDMNGISRVGLTAGASTPDEVIIRVYNRIKEINRDTNFARSIDDIPLFKEESC